MGRDKEKQKAMNKAYYFKNIEKIKAYRKTPASKKTTRIGHWKNRGLHVDDYDELYKKYLETTHCEKCGVEFVDGKRTNASKCADHDHYKIFNNFRAFLCHHCNVTNDNSSNTSGIPNIHKKGDRWRYSKRVYGKKRHEKTFKTKQEAIDYKKDYESSL